MLLDPEASFSVFGLAKVFGAPGPTRGAVLIVGSEFGRAGCSFATVGAVPGRWVRSARVLQGCPITLLDQVVRGFAHGLAGQLADAANDDTQAIRDAARLSARAGSSASSSTNCA